MRTYQSGGLSTGVRARILVCAPGLTAADELVERLSHRGFETVAVASSDVIPNESRAAIVVIDDSGPEWLRLVGDIDRHPAQLLPFVLAERAEPDVFVAALAAGAAGFCDIASPLDSIVRAIESLHDEGYAVPRAMTAALVDHVRTGRGRIVNSAAGPIKVTDREWEILSLLVQRRSTREMSDALFVSVGTVRSHISTLINKLGATDRDDAVRMIELGHRRD